MYFRHKLTQQVGTVNWYDNKRHAVFFATTGAVFTVAAEELQSITAEEFNAVIN